jgi:hypothetical protein
MTLQEARPGGFEPPTYGLEIRCSIRLSYGRIYWVHQCKKVDEMNGLSIRCRTIRLEAGSGFAGNQLRS